MGDGVQSKYSPPFDYFMFSTLTHSKLVCQSENKSLKFYQN